MEDLAPFTDLSLNTFIQQNDLFIIKLYLLLNIQQMTQKSILSKKAKKIIDSATHNMRVDFYSDFLGWEYSCTEIIAKEVENYYSEGRYKGNDKVRTWFVYGDLIEGKLSPRYIRGIYIGQNYTNEELKKKEEFNEDSKKMIGLTSKQIIKLMYKKEYFNTLFGKEELKKFKHSAFHEKPKNPKKDKEMSNDTLSERPLGTLRDKFKSKMKILKDKR